jgi:ATP-dependent helicase/nuclease subunit A
LMAQASPQAARELKPEQAAAAHTLDRHLSVTAGPGSGKTTVLVERYLQILRTQNVSVDNIVAITFTNRAANEMRERVRKEIDALLRTSSGEARLRWLRHKRALEGAVITTIHGFCSRLLHEFPVEANIDPQFSLLDEHQAVMLLEGVVEEALSDAIHHGNEKIVKLAQGLGGRGTLAARLVDLFHKYRGEGLALNDIRKSVATNHAAAGDYPVALRELDARMAEMLATPPRTPAARIKHDNLAIEWPRLRAIISKPPTEETMAAYCQAIEDFWEARPKKGSNPLVPAVDALLWGTDSKTDDRLGGKVPAIGFDLLAKDYATALLNLIEQIERRLDDEKQKLSVLDFDDLQLRTLKLLNEHPETLARISDRYRFFLVDEFQDTNNLQRDLMTKVALRRDANLFIVGDRKQSIYGFRGADVDVFREMTTAIEAAGGTRQPLHLNFRSQQPLISALNFLFAKVFRARSEVPANQLDELGFVSHEASVGFREAKDAPPMVEFLVGLLPETGRTSANSDDDSGDSRDAREHDAAQLVERINELTATGAQASRFQSTDAEHLGSERDARAPVQFGDIAVLFRALTNVGSYESALRRAGIPYLTVQGKGFFKREEVTDLIQLLRFLDNATDEIALAAVLRSPLGGISDNALFALRSAPLIGEQSDAKKLPRRNLWRAVRHHREIQFIDESEHDELDRVGEFLGTMLQRRNRYSIADLLRFAVDATDFLSVLAANFDGAQRIANVEKLFRLAEAFEKSGQLIRDFVHYVEEFEEIGGRESEGQLDKTANVVRLMTIHQAKGLEFPVVIIPDLHRSQAQRDPGSYVLDRHRGFTVAVPDGRGGMARGALFRSLRQRVGWREEFESMRLLYVAATRAEDRLIFSGAVMHNDLKNLTKTEREQWMAWVWQALQLDEHPQSRVLKLADDVQIDLRINRRFLNQHVTAASNTSATVVDIDLSQSLEEIFPLLRPVPPERGTTLRRFSVTQLINFQRCARQYYFERLLRAPGAEELAAWNDAEAPEPPANLTATLKGAVIHRFCETFCDGDDVRARLRASFEHVKLIRQAELAGRAFEIDTEAAVDDLLPLAQNYLASDVFQRVLSATRHAASENPKSAIRNPKSSAGLWSELRFRLRRPAGILTGTIDKLLIVPSADAEGFDVEIIDFKTNRFSANDSKRRRPELLAEPGATAISTATARASQANFQSPQGVLDFESPQVQFIAEAPKPEKAPSLASQIETVARDYQLQMQSYALALRELLAADARINNLRATLHFIDPNVESRVPLELLRHGLAGRAIDDAMLTIASLDGTLDAERFPTTANSHCRMCNFKDLCPAGREWLRGR